MNYVALSKEISYALRHAPWELGLELDGAGYVALDQLLSAVNERGHHERVVTADDVREMMAAMDKQRFELSDGKIRALYGHTTPQKIAKEASKPPAVLYHGTSHGALAAIMTEGLMPMKRQYVHLSVDIASAVRVGSRRDPDPVLLSVDAKAAHEDGLVFHRGNDKVWLADEVPPKYLKCIERE